MPNHVRIEDSGIGPGVPLAAVIVPTITIPPSCGCTWIVVAAGPGAKCLSQLRRQNAACPELRAHRRMEQAVSGEEGSDPMTEPRGRHARKDTST